MKMDGLIRQLFFGDEPPPPPPLFGHEGERALADFWRPAFGVDTGSEAWRLLVEHAGDVMPRDEPIVSAKAWEHLCLVEVQRRAERMSRIGADIDLQEDERRVASADYWYWLHHHAWIPNPQALTAGGRDIPFLAWPAQIAVMWWLRESIRLYQETGEEQSRLQNKSRAVGASLAFVAVLLHPFLFDRAAFEGKMGSIGGDEADDFTADSLMGKAEYLLLRQPRWLAPTEIRRVHHRLENVDTGSSLKTETMNRNFGRSGRALVTAMDERAWVDARLQQLSRVGSSSVGRVTWRVSTPNGTGEEFSTLYGRAADEDKLEIPAFADPRRDRTWWEGLLIENGGTLTWDEREQEYGCSFRGVSGARIWHPDPDIVFFDDDDPEWQEVRYDALYRWLKVTGWDFGTLETCERTAAVDWEGGIEHGEYGKLPRLWWLSERVWHRQTAETIAGEHKVLHDGQHRGEWRIVGDPSGVSEHIGEYSWQAELRRWGVRISCLPKLPYDQHGWRIKAIELIAEMQRIGLWRVHQVDCPQTCSSENAWQWDVQGRDPGTVSREQIKWKKDGPSHLCEAGLYAAMYTIISCQPGLRQGSVDRSPLDDLPSSLDGGFGGLFT